MGDVVIAARSAKFAFAYGAIGLTPDGGASWFLPRLIGMRRAQELALLNRRLSGEEAAELGLITRVVVDEAFAGEGMGRARGRKGCVGSGGSRWSRST